jgi:uncharacterized protein (DUF2141 family)
MKIQQVGSVLMVFMIPLAGIGGRLEVEVVGARNTKGQIKVGVYKDKETFPKTGSEFKGIDVSPVNKDANVAVFELPEGTYAVAIIHDENKNGKLDKNFLGIPKEGYGFSNDAKATFGSPSFEEASFIIETVDKKIKINLKN